jgi:hypothetical protein
LFSPFAAGESGDGGKVPAETAPAQAEAKAPKSKPSEDEIATLKAELTAMQQRLEQLSRR